MESLIHLLEQIRPPRPRHLETIVRPGSPRIPGELILRVICDNHTLPQILFSVELIPSPNGVSLEEIRYWAMPEVASEVRSILESQYPATPVVKCPRPGPLASLLQSLSLRFHLRRLAQARARAMEDLERALLPTS